MAPSHRDLCLLVGLVAAAIWLTALVAVWWWAFTGPAENSGFALVLTLGSAALFSAVTAEED